jgi:KDO2-lipid IV(A) lauroyltransferase
MRNFLEFIPFFITASLVNFMPRKMALKFGKTLGLLGCHLLSRRHQIATENIRGSFPDMPKKEIDETIEQMFKGLGKSFVEMLRLDHYQSPQDLETFFEVFGQENIRKALLLNRGCIILTGHIGFWETGNFLLPKLGFPTGVVAKPMRNVLVDRYFSKKRTAGGSYIINSRKGARAILKALQKNHCVCILLDQHIAGKGSVSVPFFGRMAHTTSIITQMAIRYKVPIVPGFAYRQQNESYRCEFNKMVVLDGELTQQNILDKTAELNHLIEDGIRKDISQWFWLHRRWRKCCEE